jgi:hypothetical protein
MTTKKTSASKQPVESLRAELRVLNNAATDVADDKDWITPEFVSMVSSVAVNLITAATVVGWLDANNAQEVTKAITALIAAASTISVNGFIVWKYLGGREAVKKEAIQAQYRYAETLLVERMRADSAY